MDMQKAIKYFQVLSELPEEVDIFLQSKLFADFVRELNSVHSLPEDYLTDLTIEIIVNNFDSEFINGLENKFFDELKIRPENAKKLLKDYLGYILLPLSPYVKKLDTRTRLSRLGSDAKEYQEKISLFKNLIENYVYEEMEKVVAEKEKNFDMKKEEQALENMIREDMVYLLENPTKELNGGVVALLFADSNFKNVLVKIISENQQKLFSSEILVNGKKFESTISNWINNFITTHGSTYFNNLVLSEYVTNSKYSGNLSGRDKELLIKLLTLYRNIRFFPQSFEGISPEKWEVFPLNVKSKSEASGHQPLAAPKSPEELEIENLEKMAAGYELGSLERRAVEEEIRKMKLSIRYQGAVRK